MGTLSEPSIGNRNDKKTRYYRNFGLKTFLITNKKDLEMLLMNNRTYCGEIAHNISARKRAELITRAKELNVRLTNGNAKVTTAPSE